MRENIAKREGLGMGRYRNIELRHGIKWTKDGNWCKSLGVPIGSRRRNVMTTPADPPVAAPGYRVQYHPSKPCLEAKGQSRSVAIFGNYNKVCNQYLIKLIKPKVISP